MRILRAYWLYAPTKRGKGYLLRRAFPRLLPGEGAEFATRLPGGHTINLRYQEDIGIYSWLTGGFERGEREMLGRLARPGAVVIDVGANVGIVTAALAAAVGPDGFVHAFEPLPGNACRLARNMIRNELLNVAVWPMALGESDGDVALQIARDPAYASVAQVAVGFETEMTLTVPSARLDSLWRSWGMPDIGLIKIDVEGAEVGVLRGAELLVKACRPSILAEAHSDRELMRIEEELSRLGYLTLQPRTFNAWNYLFLPIAKP